MTVARVAGLEVVHWNPQSGESPRPIRALGLGKRVNNFGDLLGPMLVQRILKQAGFSGGKVRRGGRRLLTVGSILHLAHAGDVVWGTGVNGKVGREMHTLEQLDFRAVRGPRTRAWLARHGFDAPDVYGDPALLFHDYFPELRDMASRKAHRLAVIPNFHDMAAVAGHPDTVDARADVMVVLERIVRSEAVVASSLHGLVIAEAFGIPAFPVVSRVEPAFKYIDYYEGTGRFDVQLLESWGEALSLVRKRRAIPDPLERWPSQTLIDAFPLDLVIPADTGA